MPLRLGHPGRSGPAAGTSRHAPPLAHSFCPFTTYVRRPPGGPWCSAARSEPASGSEKPCTQISPSRIAGDAVASAPRFRQPAGWMRRGGYRRRRAPGEVRPQQPTLGRALPARPLTSRRPTRRPARHRVAGLVELGEPPLLERNEFGFADAGLAITPVRRDVLGTPRPHPGAELVEITHAYNPVKPRRPTA